MEVDAVHVEGGRGLVLVTETHEAELGEHAAAENRVARPQIQMRRVHRTVEKGDHVLGKRPLLDVTHVQILSIGITRLDHVEVRNSSSTRS